ncbi:MAG: hypothetical protein IT557_14115 [Alphaproteobacteria bacterium]|nr:hypothetical protein [Alphaproteobacteria bacterium]
MASVSNEDRPVVVTDGRRRFRVTRPWERTPPGFAWGKISQLCVSASGEIVVAQRADPALVVFRPDGSHSRSLHHPQLASVHGLWPMPDGRLYVATFDAHQVLCFGPDGTLLQEFGRFDHPSWQAPFNHPTDVSVAADGEVYVSDGYGNARIHRFAPDGRLLQSWGEPGTGPGQFAIPHAVLVTGDGRVLVLDRDNDRIQVFARDGRLLEIWGGFCRPMDIWGDATGHFYVSDQTPRISCLDPAGRVVGRCRAFGTFSHGIWGDAQGNLFCAEQGPSLVAKYTLID